MKIVKATMANCPPRYTTPLNPARPNLLEPIVALAKVLGIKLLPWQKHVIALLTEMDDDGNPYYRFALVTVPRQSGKTEIVAWLLAFYRMLLWPRQPQHVLWRAQSLVDTSHVFLTKILPRIKADPDFYQECKWKLAMGSLSNPRMTLGATDSTLRLVSSGKGSGHGSTTGLVIVDEAWTEADASSEQSLVFSQRALPDRQYLIFSTAGDMSSTYLRALVDSGRRRVEEGTDTRSAYVEWSAADEDDISDPVVWAKATPSWGHFVDEETMAEEYDRFKSQGLIGEFERGALNKWVDSVEDPCIPYAAFDAVIQTQKGPEGVLFAAADCNPEREASYIAISDGEVVEPVWAERGTSGIYQRLRMLWSRNMELEGIALAKGGPLSLVGERLEQEEGANIIWMNVELMRHACGAFYDAVLEGRLSLYDSQGVSVIRSSLPKAYRAESAREWIWRRHDPSFDIAGLWAASLAYYASVMEDTSYPVEHAPTEEKTVVNQWDTNQWGF